MSLNLKTVDKILRYLAKYPYATANEIAKFIKKSPATVMKYLREMYKMGMVTFREIGNLRRWRIDEGFSDGVKALDKMFRVKR